MSPHLALLVLLLAAACWTALATMLPVVLGLATCFVVAQVWRMV